MGIELGRLAARTMSIEEARVVSQQFESQGYSVNIKEIKQGHLSMFEVWVSKEKEGFLEVEETLRQIEDCRTSLIFNPKYFNKEHRKKSKKRTNVFARYIYTNWWLG